MRGRTIGVLIGLAALGPVASASAAGDPIMPLRDVRSGMKCTGYSVFRGQQVETFDVEIVDVVGEASTASSDPRLLFRVSGPKVDATGVGPGFSGSPIYCPTANGTMANAGAISLGVGEYGGKMGLATPIEQILGTAVDGPRPKRAGRMSRRDAALLAHARPLSGPITVAGLGAPLMRGLSAAGRRHGLAVIAAPPVPADSAPIVPFRPGSAVSVGLSSGDITVSAVGTVAYTDGPKVWAFGHPLDGVGARSLLLQDAYVSAIVSNPIEELGGSYKFAGAVHDVGTLTDDGFNAVAGRTGALPPRARVRVHAKDIDRDVETDTEVQVPDETDLGNPTGFSDLGFVAPIAVGQGATEVLGSAPQRLAGRMCFEVKLRERREPLRFCNRYVSDGTLPGDGSGANPVALSAGTDAQTALSLLDGYKGKPVHVTETSAQIAQTRAQRQAYLRKVTLPRRVRRGRTVPGRLVVQVVRGPRRAIDFRWRVPHALKPGRRTLDLRGVDPDSGGGFFDEIAIDLGGGADEGKDEYFDTEGPKSVKQLVRAFEAVHHYDGIRLKSGAKFYRDPTLRIGGRARTTVLVRKRR